MKYSVGNIVTLFDGRTVYISSIDSSNKKYIVFETGESSEELFSVAENEIYLLVT